MKKLFILTVLILSTTQAHAYIQCRIAREKPFIVDGEATHGLIKNFTNDVQGRQTLYADDHNLIEVDFDKNKLALYSSDPETAGIYALAASKATDYLMLYDTANRQTITCEKMDILAAGLSPRYVRSAGEGGSEPKGPKSGGWGCWVISCAY